MKKSKSRVCMGYSYGNEITSWDIFSWAREHNNCAAPWYLFIVKFRWFSNHTRLHGLEIPEIRLDLRHLRCHGLQWREEGCHVLCQRGHDLPCCCEVHDAFLRLTSHVMGMASEDDWRSCGNYRRSRNEHEISFLDRERVDSREGLHFLIRDGPHLRDGKQIVKRQCSAHFIMDSKILL